MRPSAPMTPIVPLFLWLVAMPAAGPGAGLRADQVVELGEHRFTIPDGLTVELVAGPPLVDRPITAAFDEQGRLYVAESSGSNDPVQQQLEEKPHRILRLEDTDGDGVFDRRTVFADAMMFPEGTMWLDGSLYVAAPPHIWKLTDTTGDGIADAREVWLDAKTLTGCANDLHGPYLGPDGWIYWAKGAFAEQTYDRDDEDAPPFVTRAAHLFRWRADRQGPIEAVMTGGMDNPVDVAFTPGGERIFTTTFFQHPAGGLRDGLIHALYGGVYGKVHSVIEGHPRTRPGMMPVLTHLGPAAPSGLERLRGSGLGDDYRDNLLACQFNLRAVSRHVLEPDGGSFTTVDSLLIQSDNSDFHPTDVIEDADGSVLVIDTGGWYKLCCPTSQLHKPDVLGGIYRVRKADATGVDDPRGLAIAWDDAATDADALAPLLSDPRPAVRERAVAEMARLGPEAVPALVAIVNEADDAEARLNAVWASSRIDEPGAREVARIALKDDDETVIQAALHAISVRRDRGALDRVVNLLHTGSPQNRRAAAEATGRLGDPSSVPFLLQAAADVPEAPHWAVHHSITHALIELADPDATRFGLSAPHDTVRRAALVALDQMPGDHLEAADVVPLLSAEDPDLREAAAWVAGRRPRWGADLARHFERQLRGTTDDDDEAGALVELLAGLASSGEIQRVIGGATSDPEAPDASRRVAMAAMARSGLDPAPESWIAAVASAIESEALRGSAVSTARALRVPGDRAEALRAPLLRIARDPEAGPSDRLDALTALPGGIGSPDDELFTFLLDRLDPDAPAAEQTRAADLLAASKLDDDRLLMLADRIAEAGSLSVPRLLRAFDDREDEGLGIRLVEALDASPSRSSLAPGDVRALLDRFGPTVAERASTLLAAIDADAERKRERIEALLPLVERGDVYRGQAVFNGEKAACRTCHAMGYVGGKVGPDLSRIGGIRTERDLIEAIVYPSASFVRSYETIVVATLDGRVVNGILGDEGPDHVTLVLNADETVRIARDEIEEMQPGTTSIMPAGLDEQLTPQELADLVKFLKASQ